MGNRIENLGGSVTQRSISGSIQTGKGMRELRFAERSGFPETGVSTMLYIAIDENKTYRWDESRYVEVSGGSGTGDNVIDDERVALNKTWSSSKISDEFEEDRTVIDNLANVVAITNLEIEAILNR